MKGNPRQMFATMVAGSAVLVWPSQAIGMSVSAVVPDAIEDLVQHAEEPIEDPAPDNARHNRGEHPGQQKEHAEHATQG